ncbi:MAG: family 16 glycosylhydrolase [Corynebacterium sp.]|nr:family 16 glycosylhydrolase [Corynebacterium sp.]
MTGKKIFKPIGALLTASALFFTSLLATQNAIADENDPFALTSYDTESPSSPSLSQEMLDLIGRQPSLRISSQSDDFSTDTTSKYYRYDNRTSFNASDALWSAGQTSVHDGVMDIKAVRQCVDSDGNARESIEPCDSDEETQYVSDRVILQNIPEGNFTLSFRARLNSQYYEGGVRANFVLQTQGTNCSTNPDGGRASLSPLDYFLGPYYYEWNYTEVGCANSGTAFSKADYTVFGEEDGEVLSDAWHTYTIEVFDGNVVYLRDGEAFATYSLDTLAANSSEENVKASLGDNPWNFYFEPLVSASGSSVSRNMGNMDNDADFYPAHLYLDYIQIAREHDSKALEVEDPADPPVVGDEMLDYLRYTPTLTIDQRISNNFTDDSWADSVPSAAEANRMADNSDTWYYATNTHYKGDNSSWTRDNFSVHDGVLDLALRRHCVETMSEALTDDNYQVEPCPSGKITRYSAPRLYSPQTKHENYVLTIRAYITGDADRIDGVRSNLWMQNNQQMCNAAYPDSEYVELDLLEQYSSRQNTQYATSHVGCVKRTTANGTVYAPTQVQTRMNVSEGYYDQWHTWSLQVFNNHIAYYLDGKFVGDRLVTRADFYDTADEYDKAMSNPLRLIVENMVETQMWATPVNDSKDFPDQHFLIDYIQMAYEENPQEVPIDPTTVQTVPASSSLPMPTYTKAPTAEPMSTSIAVTEHNTEVVSSTTTTTVTEPATITEYKEAVETTTATEVHAVNATVQQTATATDTVIKKQPHTVVTETVTAEPVTRARTPWYNWLIYVIAGLLTGKVLTLFMNDQRLF